MNTVYEYLVEPFKLKATERLSAELSARGAQGWEIVAALNPDHSDIMIVVFKREKKDEGQPRRATRKPG